MNNGCDKQPHRKKMEAMYMKFYPGFRSFDLFDDFGLTTSSQLMKTDICEKRTAIYELSMEVPGIKKEDIQLELKRWLFERLPPIVTPTMKKKTKMEELFVRNVLPALVRVVSMLVKTLKKKTSRLTLTMVN